MLRGTLLFNSALELIGVGILLAAARAFAASGQLADAGLAVLLGLVLIAAAGGISLLVLRPRYQPIGLVAVINAASGVVAFMLIAAGQIEPVSSIPAVAFTGALLLGVAGLLMLELRKVRA